MKTTDKLIGDLKERAKELRCLYEVEKAVNQVDRPLAEVMANVVEVIGAGWQHPEVCVASIELEGQKFESEGFQVTPWVLRTDISLHDEVAGKLSVYYTAEMLEENQGPFLTEEVELLRSLADRLGHYLLFKKMQSMGKKWREVGHGSEGDDEHNWRVIVDLLRETDDSLFLRITRKMLNFLCSIGISEAQEMLSTMDQDYDPLEVGNGESNVAEKPRHSDLSPLIKGEPFAVAAKYITGNEIIGYVQKWIQADRAASFLNVLDNPRSTLSEVQEALRRFQQSTPDGDGMPASTMKSVRVSLTQKILTEQLDFVKTAKNHVSVSFFRDLMDRIVMPTECHGKLGGKAAGMLLAHCILRQRSQKVSQTVQAENAILDKTSEVDWKLLGEIRIPRTWHIASDAALDFITYNDLEDVLHQKYKGLDEVRRDYPNIIRLFKNSSFPPSLVHGMSAALDDFQGVPIVIRSSSLLEDRVGTAFSGKYKSLFLANQGSKKECLAALQSAVAEIYASMFGPDPIEYRTERGVLEFDEQMGILIQEVVGTHNGKYFFPTLAGVAFSQTEFRWSPRISREDGLVRLVPGLGTRAVDRTGDDYPVLIVPGKPELRVNVAVDEIVRYSPRDMDVINLETNAFETVSVQDMLKEVGGQYPGLPMVFSVLKDGRLIKPVSLLIDPEKEQLVPTFDEVRSDQKFLPQVRGLLKVLEETLQTPVDVEFAHDGEHLYLLQCRPQSQSAMAAPAPIPQDLPAADIIFTANRFVSNGRLEDITHVVYVDSERYGNLSSLADMKKVGRAVSELNKLLPRKRFILMGPGRWGSRGDIKLGVNVTYADINNTAMLIEIARQTGSYVPDVSFGTHFFQDLVEADIGYLPLYPDDEGITFAERFLLGSTNIFPELVPKYAHLADVIRVVDMADETEGRVMKILLNSDLDQAVAYIADPGTVSPAVRADDKAEDPQRIRYWLWRKEMSERIALDVDHERLGVKKMYLIGSVKNAVAGPASDIDLLIHCNGDDEQRQCLLTWLDGWSRCLSEINFLKTGYRTDGLLDVHLVTDEDIEKRSSFAIKIGAVTDAAYELPLSGD
ncbi:MAG: PEP/pyruvate-binding domain-containing protein [Candidatus Krumholzibacteria bacterium]|nr:PEP/pyruvate-binding domain-containing protein [Candidatus Krumholzibacteria bacterium]